MIIIKTPEEIKKMKESGKIVSQVLSYLRDQIVPGITTKALDELAGKKIQELGGASSFLKYRINDLIYPAYTCISVDNKVVHGIPSEKEKLKEGQIVSLDCGINYNGWHGDSAITVGVGKISEKKQNLIDLTYQALWAGIKAVKPAGKLSEVTKAIETFITSKGPFGIVKGYGGHGIGRKLHEAPYIPNTGKIPTEVILKAGVVIALEPMVNLGSDKVHTLEDEWTVVTDDGTPSAHFEHTVAVTETGYEVLTLRSDENIG